MARICLGAAASKAECPDVKSCVRSHVVHLAHADVLHAWDANLDGFPLVVNSVLGGNGARDTGGIDHYDVDLQQHRNSTLSAVLFHFMMNFTGEFLGLPPGIKNYQFMWLVVIAVVVVILYGPRTLSRNGRNGELKANAESA
jgi:hypothetical protein